MKPTLLGLETSTQACSVALMCNGTLYHRFDIIPQQHTQQIFPMINAVLSEAGVSLSSIDALAVGRGPGSFTGLRIAVSVAQGLGYALNKPVYPVSTLETIALQAREHKKDPQMVLVTLDARMQEVYTGLYKVTPSTVEVLEKEHIISIDGFKEWKNTLPASVLHLETYPHAKEVALLAYEAFAKGDQGLRAQDVLPVYLRDKITQ